MEVAGAPSGNHRIVPRFRPFFLLRESVEGVIGLLRRASVFQKELFVSSAKFICSKKETEDVSVPSPRHPLAGLAVYIDVNFRAVLEMLRIAGIAAAQEAAAAVRLGKQGRFQKAACLHRNLEKLWLLPGQQLAARPVWGKKSTFLDSLQHQLKEGVQESSITSSTTSDTSSSPNISLSRDGSRGVSPYEAASVTSAQWDTSTKESSKRQDRPAALPSTSLLDPLLRQDGSVIAPPLHLLAAYAEPVSRKEHPVASGHRFSTATGTVAAPRRMQTSRSTPGCVVGLCVRSLLDLYIQAIRSLQPALLPRDSVVLVAAVNAPMMFKVLEEHQLLVHPLDLDPQTLMPTEESLRQAAACWGSRIKALLFPHLYGGLCNVELLADFCTKHRLLFIEDCAEAFVGGLYRGHPRADISLFSFGLIKTCTAAGGGIATVRSRLVAARMQTVQALYPFGSRRTFFKKLLVTLGACCLQTKFVMKNFLRFCYLPGWNPGSFLQSFVRGFPSSGELFKLLRVQPNASTLAVLLKRLESWSLAEFAEQQERILEFARNLQQFGLHIPGTAAAFKTFWLFPVLTPAGSSPAEFECALRERGLYAASDATTLICCNSPPSTDGGMAALAVAPVMMRRIVYLPVNRHSTEYELRQVEKAVCKACEALTVSRASASSGRKYTANIA